MPTIILNRIPLPSLRLYTAISVLLVSACIYYSINVTSDPFWKLQTNSSISPTNGVTSSKHSSIDDLAAVIVEAENRANEAKDGDSLPPVIGSQNGDESLVVPTKMENKERDDRGPKSMNDSRTLSGQLKDVISFMSQEPVCIWTLINMAYCCLVLLGKSIQKVVFGELRISEEQHMKDKFWNFVFYKFIFIFGVVNVQFLHEVVLWISWFSVLGFQHILSQLCKDRFEYLSFSPTTPGWSHFRLVALLSAILTLSGFMFIICIGAGLFGGINTFAFMAAECILLSIRTTHVLVRYGMFLYDMRQGGMGSEAIAWDKRGPVAYYIELSFEVAILIIDLLHHSHMLFWSNIFLSMASLVIIMQLRYLIHEIQRKVKKHRNYLWVLNHMEKSYPLATAQDLSQNSDNCAICWEKMESARKLPCSHLFHNSCLQSWLEQDTSCPTCRLALSVQNNVALHPNIDRIDETETAGRANNHFFHFNGSRYVSWLPNFSVEVTHINNMLRNDPLPQTAAHTSQIRNMARQVQQMFPRYPLSVIISDLQISRSIEVTIDNILEGRLQIPARFQELEDDDFNENGTGSVNRNNGTGNTDSEATTSGSSDGGEFLGHRDGFAVNSARDYYVNPDMQFGASDSDNSLLETGYEVERNSNIFGNHNDLLRDDNFEDAPLGDRFSKSSTEREKILQRRKDILLTMARKRYIDKNKAELNLPLSDSNRNRNKSSMQN